MSSTLKILKLLGDSTRLRILMLLKEEPLSVAELQEILGMAQSRISTQLSLLKAEQVVEDRRSGKNNIYSLSLDGSLWEVAAAAGAELKEQETDRRALEHLLRKRQDKARAHFDALAGKFGKSYVPGRSWKALAEGLLNIGRFGVVVDLGAGEGTLSQLMAPRAEKVIAVDHAPEMVNYGKALALEHGLKNLEYRLGDLERPPVEAGSADLVVLSQALHHASDPKRALVGAFHLLKPGGQIWIMDLLQHQFEEAREWYADTWLGFAESELAAFLEHAGFINIDLAVVDRESEPPHFQTLMATAQRKH